MYCICGCYMRLYETKDVRRGVALEPASALEREKREAVVIHPACHPERGGHGNVLGMRNRCGASCAWVAQGAASPQCSMVCERAWGLIWRAWGRRRRPGLSLSRRHRTGLDGSSRGSPTAGGAAFWQKADLSDPVSERPSAVSACVSAQLCTAAVRLRRGGKAREEALQ